MVTQTAHLSKCVCICSRDLCIYLGRLYSTINIPMVIIYLLMATTNFSL